MNKLFTLLAVVCFSVSSFANEEATQREPLELIHFFVFDGDLANNTPFEELEFTYSLNEEAYIYFHSALEGYPFDPDHPNWRKASMERRNAPTPINYRPEGNSGIPYDDAGMRGLQVKQPFTGDGGENTMFFHLPTVGFENVVFSFAAKDEGAADMMIIDYSVVAGDPVWVEDGLSQTEFTLLDEFELFEIDFLGIDGVNDNPNFMIRMRFDGEDMEEDDGDRVTFNNFALDGQIKTGGVATILDVVSVNDGQEVYVNEAFSLLIHVLDDNGIPTEVDSDVTVTLTLATGDGNLSGNLTGIIEEGNWLLEIEGILYDTAEEGVSIMADADDLEAAVSDAFNVHVRTYALTLESFPPGAGVLTGGGDYEAGAEVTVSADSGEDYAFNNWSLGDEVISEDPEFVFTMPANDVTLVASFDMLGDVLLIHYWHFNDEVIEGEEEDYLVISDFSLVGQGGITYPGEGDGYVDFRSHRESDPVSNFNLRLGQEPDQGAVLRVRNPAITRELIFAVPSTDFTDLVVTFATTRTENGAQEQQFYFSPDAGATWVAVGDSYEIPFMEDEEGIYLHKEIDLSAYDEVNDNPDLHFKILFVGEGNDNDSGNNRFDNFTVDGRALSDDVNVNDIVEEATMNVYPNPASGMFRIETDQYDMLIRIYDLNGRMVMQRAMSGTSMSVDATSLPVGLYLIRGVSPTDNISVTKRLLIQ